jgi:hypothetical protein
VSEHGKYVSHATCGDLYYVNRTFDENRFIVKRMLNHARSRTRALARMHAVREHDKYVAHVHYAHL